MTALAGSVVAFPEAEVSLLDAYLRGLPSPGTRAVYKRAVRDFGAFLGPARELLGATRRDVEAYRARLEADGRAGATISQHSSALSGFFQFALDEGAVDKDPAARARRPKVPNRSMRHGTEVHETRAMLATCCGRPEPTLIELRDCALLTALALQAWRIDEALGLRLEGVSEEAGHKVAEVVGKGGRVDRVPLAAATWSALSDLSATPGGRGTGPG